jgi:hypothetical protein
MASRAEQKISRSLRAILADLPSGASFADSEQLPDVLTGLEYFLPVVLGEIHQEWKQEGLDGVLPLAARKTGDGEAEIFGLCIILSDQTLAPLHLHLQIADFDEEISWLECRLGERGQHGMMRTPYCELTAMKKRLHTLEGRADLIDWVYKVTFGQRRL